MKKKIGLFFICFLIIIGSIFSALLSIIAIPYMPFESYADKMLAFSVIYSFLVFILLLQLLPSICSKLFDNCIHMEKTVIFCLCVVLVILILKFVIIRGIAPERLSYLYYCIKCNTQQNIFENDDVCGAIEETVELDMNNSKYLLEAGNTFYKVGNYNKSIVFYRDALEKNKDDANSNYLLGRAYLCGHPGDNLDYEEFEFDTYNLFHAEKYLFRANELSPENASYNYELGMTYYYLYTKQNSNDIYYEKAVHYLESAINNSSFDSKYYYWLGRILFYKESDRAKDIFEELTNYNEYVAPYQYWLGRSYLAIGKNIEAGSCFELAKELDDNNTEYQLYADSTSNLVSKDF